MNPVGCFQNRGKKKTWNWEGVEGELEKGSEGEFDQNSLYEYTKF